MREVKLMMETSNWRSRKVKYIAGNWSLIKEYIPSFELRGFYEDDGKIVNPYYKKVVRLPLTPLENRIPVGLVSNTYTLAQHKEVATLCMEGIKKNCGIDIESVRCELGLSALSEWMNLRIYFPDEYDFIPLDDNPLKLRLECFNSVDGSSRLVILFGWFRLVCSNGMIIGKTIAELRDLHNQHMDLAKISSLIANAMQQIDGDKKMMRKWEAMPLRKESLAEWVDTTLSEKWGKLGAFRVYHICLSGQDAKYSHPFEAVKPSRKSVAKLDPIPGSPSEARNLYDVGQALSWVATNRNKVEEKTRWQTDIPILLKDLASPAA